jgi:hypothetical protein
MLRLQQDLRAGPTGQTVAMIVNGVVVGALLTKLVERPAHRALMRMWDRRHRSVGGRLHAPCTAAVAVPA